MSGVTALRVRTLNDRPVRPAARYVLYWMTANRRLRANHALDRAVEHAKALERPLLVLEPLRCDYPHASDRLHAFVLAGMRDHEAEAQRAGVRYLPWVEPRRRARRGLLRALAAEAAVVVTDDVHCLFYPRMLEAAARQVPVRLEAVDADGLLPVRAADTAFPTAYAFRRFLQKTLPDHLEASPAARPLARLPDGSPASVPRAVLDRWPPAKKALLEAQPDALASLPIDHEVAPVGGAGGPVAGRRVLRRFLRERLAAYTTDRSDPKLDVASGLSPYLHFGHVGAWEVFQALARHEGWEVARLGARATGKRTGWWGMSEAAEAFVDQLVTWRELGRNACAWLDDYLAYESLPSWARRTLDRHASDPRPYRYDLNDLEGAATHDGIWNAAQRQLLEGGHVHNYLRMLWGKKILEWTKSPREALEVMVHLNDKYALDGRDANSYSGIFWTLGRYDRPWGPERPVFGTIRYMSSDRARQRWKLGGLDEFADPPPSE